MIEEERTRIVPIVSVGDSYRRAFESKISKARLDISATITKIQPDGGIALTVTINRSGGAGHDLKKELYSLLNLGIQGRRRSAFIFNVAQGKATFKRLKGPLDPSEKVRGPYTGSEQPLEKNRRIRRLHSLSGGYDKYRAWYMLFEGDICELKVVAFFTKVWEQFPGGDDDWAPPPPDPGGEYGEDDESGDPEEEDDEEKKKKKVRKKRGK